MTSAGSHPGVTLPLFALIVAAALGVLILGASQAGTAHAEGESRPYDHGLVEMRAPSERPFELPVELEVAFFVDCSETSGLQPPKCGDPPVRWVGAANPVTFCTFQGGRPSSIDAETFREAVRTAVQAWSDAEAAVGVRYDGDCETGSRWESNNDRNEVGYDDSRNLVQGNSAAVTLGAWVNIFPDGFSSVVTDREFVETDIVIDHALDIPEQCFVSTIVHEFGHALGFGHSDSADDLMFPSFNPSNLNTCPLTPSSAEGTQLQSLYGVDLAPTADAGGERLVDIGAAVLLSGGGSDPEGGALTFAWAQLDGEPVTLLDAGTASAAFDAPETDATLRFELTVMDEFLHRATDTVLITVGASSEPPSRFPSFASFKLNDAADGATLGWTSVDGAADYELCSSFSSIAIASFCDVVEQPQIDIDWDTIVGSAGSATQTKVFNGGWKHTQIQACNSAGCSDVAIGPIAGGLRWDAWGIDFDYFAIAFDVGKFQFTLVALLNVDGPIRVVEFTNGPPDDPGRRAIARCGGLSRFGTCWGFLTFNDGPQDEIVRIFTRRPGTPSTEHLIRVR